MPPASSLAELGLDSAAPWSADAIARVEALARREATPTPQGELVWRVWGGDGPALVMLHGGYGSWVHWVRNVLPLSRYFTVLAPDTPGLGDSAPPPAPYTASSIAQLMVDGIERILPPGASFNLVGFSFGAVIGGQIAAMLGPRLRSFTLVGASGMGLPRASQPPLEKFRRDMPAEALANLARRNLEILMFAEPSRIDPLAIHMQTVNTLSARVKSRSISRSQALKETLPHIKTRLHGIWGSRDSTAAPHIASREAMLRAVDPNVDFRIIDGAGHWVAYEAAEHFNATLIDMLRPSSR
jgi:2-hydroxy-6-oxonona-2,4-dienedioate hydrolase